MSVDISFLPCTQQLASSVRSRATPRRDDDGLFCIIFTAPPRLVELTDALTTLFHIHIDYRDRARAPSFYCAGSTTIIIVTTSSLPPRR